MVNTLGIEDGDFKAGCGSAVEQLDAYLGDVRGGYRSAISASVEGAGAASDVGYGEAVCRSDEGAVSRSNADIRGGDCNRSEGKVFILARVHDTFERLERDRSFWGAGGAGAGAGDDDGDGDIVSDGASSCVDTAGSSGVGDVDDGAGGTMGEGLGTDCAGCVVSFIDNVLI